MNPRYLLLYLPVFLTYLFQTTNPSLAYWIAWGGSFWIYLITFTGLVRPLPTDRPILNQVFRPFFLVHLIFSGYMTITSIFFYLDAMGYFYLDKIKSEESFVYISSIAYCQFLYCLGHAAYIHGLLLFLDYKPPKYVIQVSSQTSISKIFFFTTLFFFLGSVVFRFIPGGAQFLIQFQLSTAVFAVFAFGYSLLEKKKNYIFITGLLFCYGEFQALTSGWKEFTVLPILLLGAILWTKYKKTILFTAPFMIFLFLFVIPYYTGIVRGLSWGKNVEGTQAAAIALDKVRNENIDGLLEENWSFLIYRLSEIKMFMVYVDKVPTQIPYMTDEILTQSLESILPRILYPNKPVPDEVIMERVYKIGAVGKGSNVSAKPAFIADSYIMGGEIGIFCSLFLLGVLVTLLSKKAESLFGGYAIGSGCMFLGLFYILIRGNAFEFMINSVFWSIVTMYLLFYIAKRFNVLVKNPYYESNI
ncbi:exosortase Y-associated Wzy-like protein [Bernardetia sp. OM2101]|uniref:exosortase Y-associated Wzy-like protein n=1 Tax=Bernardetia sp. OM2101 TaxID=3344876 RepID=UPI0035CEDC77